MLLHASLLPPWKSRHSLLFACSSSPSKTSKGGALLFTEMRSRGMESLLHSSPMAARMAQYLVQRSKFWFRKTRTKVYPAGTSTLCSNAHARSQLLMPCSLQPLSRVQLSHVLWDAASMSWNFAFSSVSVTSTRPSIPGVQCSGVFSGAAVKSLTWRRTTDAREHWRSTLLGSCSLGARKWLDAFMGMGGGCGLISRARLQGKKDSFKASTLRLGRRRYSHPAATAKYRSILMSTSRRSSDIVGVRPARPRELVRWCRPEATDLESTP
mmetsp:Transcript_28736/g.89368  ORF Transcript_28736/g.89368 Transcript_28736/m.89368 type:complete len:268 (+) Transcript_28736:523-1326(+)